MQMLTVRVPASLVNKLDELVSSLEDMTPLGTGSVSRSAVQRQALERGIAELEAEVERMKKK